MIKILLLLLIIMIIKKIKEIYPDKSFYAFPIQYHRWRLFSLLACVFASICVRVCVCALRQDNDRTARIKMIKDKLSVRFELQHTLFHGRLVIKQQVLLNCLNCEIALVESRLHALVVFFMIYLNVIFLVNLFYRSYICSFIFVGWHSEWVAIIKATRI